MAKLSTIACDGTSPSYSHSNCATVKCGKSVPIRKVEARTLFAKNNTEFEPGHSRRSPAALPLRQAAKMLTKLLTKMCFVRRPIRLARGCEPSRSFTQVLMGKRASRRAPKRKRSPVACHADGNFSNPAPGTGAAECLKNICTLPTRHMLTLLRSQYAALPRPGFVGEG